jgi:hypothetical protein
MISTIKKRRQFTTQMLRMFEHQGPMSDKLLCWQMALLGYRSASAVKKKRRELAEKRLLSRDKVYVNKRGQLVQIWKITR